MERPIGITAKNISVEFEFLLRKNNDNAYQQMSNFLRESFFQEIIKILEEEKIAKDKIDYFTTKYQYINKKSIDEILLLNNGSQIINEIKGDLNEILQKK